MNVLSWSAESSARGYWVAMHGLFVTILVASKTHLSNYAVTINHFWFYVPSISSQRIILMDIHGHRQKLEKKMLRLSCNVFESYAHRPLSLFQSSFKIGRILWVGSILTLGLTFFVIKVIISRIKNTVWRRTRRRRFLIEKFKMKSAQ